MTVIRTVIDENGLELYITNKYMVFQWIRNVILKSIIAPSILSSS